MVAVADAIIIHDVKQCSCCNKVLPKDLSQFKARQIIDIPTIKMQVTEHRVIEKTCIHCSQKNKGAFPEGLVQQAQCNAHILRDLVYVEEDFKAKWATEISKILVRANKKRSNTLH